MQRITILFLYLLFFRFSSAQQFSLNQGGADQKDYFISLPYEDIAGKIIIPVEINSKRYRFMLDTGSPVILSTQLYDVLKPSLLRKVSLQDQSGKKDSTELAVLDKISVGGVSFTNTPAIISGNPYIFSCLNIDGVLGSNLLRNSTVQFSSKTKTIIITTDNSKLKLNKKQSAELFLDPNQSTPIVNITLENTHNKKKVLEQLVFDTGDDDFYVLALDHFKIFQQYHIFDTLAQGYGSSSYGFNGIADDTSNYRLRVDHLALNNAAFTNTRLEITMDANSRMGSKVLAYGIVTLDYKNKLFYFEPFKPKKDLAIETAEFNVSPSLNKGKLVIGIVWDPTLRDQLQRGDEVIAIDGISCDGISLCDILTRHTPFSHEIRLTLTVKNKNGEARNVVIVKN